MLIAITRLKLKSAWLFFPFIIEVHKVRIQTKKARGNKFISLHRTAGGNYWTITAWEDIASLWEFRNNNSHRKAMMNTSMFTDKVDSFHFESDKIPAWKEAIPMLEDALRKKLEMKEKIFMKKQ